MALGQIDAQLNINQRFFRARPDVLPINATPSYYNSPSVQGTSDSRNRLPSSVKDGGHAQALGGFTAGNYSMESPSKGKANKKIREATCVSLSSGAKLLAIGEVRG